MTMWVNRRCNYGVIIAAVCTVCCGWPQPNTLITIKDKGIRPSLFLHWCRWGSMYGHCTGCPRVNLACADTRRTWPVAKSAACLCALRVRPCARTLSGCAGQRKPQLLCAVAQQWSRRSRSTCTSARVCQCVYVRERDLYTQYKVQNSFNNWKQRLAAPIDKGNYVFSNYY